MAYNLPIKLGGHMQFIFLLVVIWFVLDYCEKHTVEQMFRDLIMTIVKVVVGFFLVIFILAAFGHH